MSVRYANIGAYLMVLVALIDQLTKWWVLDFFSQPPFRYFVTPNFNLVLHFNKGMSFGLFSNGHDLMPYVFIVVAMLIMGFLVTWLLRAQNMVVVFGLGLVLGGAVGNVVDRLRFGAVVDFLDFHAFGYHWPAFNVADSAIVGGVILLLIENLFWQKKTVSA